MSYCCGSKIQRYESPWGMTNKIGYWNACTITDMINHFGGRASRQCYTHNTILYKNPYSIHKFADALGKEESLIDSGSLSTYFDEDEILLFAGTTLRICPLCIKLGYHSCFHQLLPLKLCPAHNVNLTIICPHCSTKFTECFNRDIHNYFSCCNCGRRFINFEETTHGLNEYLLRYFDIVAKILILRKQNKTITARMLEFKREKNNEYFQQQVWYLWQALYIGEYVEGNEVKKLVVSNRRRCEYIYIPEKILASVADHAFCINSVGKSVFWLLCPAEIEGYHLCPYALAYIFFRMYRDSRDNGHGISFDQGPPYHKRDFDYYQYIQYATEIICLEWEELFLGCLRYAFALKAASMIRVPTPEEIGAYSIYWECADVTKGKRTVCYFQPRGTWGRQTEVFSPSHKNELLCTLENIKAHFCKSLKKGIRKSTLCCGEFGEG